MSGKFSIMIQICCIALKVLIKMVLTLRSKIYLISLRFVKNLYLFQVHFINLCSQSHFWYRGSAIHPTLLFSNFFSAGLLTPTYSFHYLMHIPDFQLSRHTFESRINVGGQNNKSGMKFLDEKKQGWWNKQVGWTFSSKLIYWMDGFFKT